MNASTPYANALPHKHDDVIASNLVHTQKDSYRFLEELSDNLALGLIIFNSEFELEFSTRKFHALLELEDLTYSTKGNLKYYLDILFNRNDFNNFSENNSRERIEAFINTSNIAKNKQGAPHAAPIKVMTPSGKILEVRPFFNEDENLVLSLKDISEQEQSNASLKMALEAGLAGYTYYNFHTHDFELHSPYLKANLTADEYKRLKENGFKEIMLPDAWKEFQSHLRKVKHDLTSCDVQFPIMTKKHRKRWIRFRATPYQLEKDNYSSVIAYAFFADITEAIQTQMQLRNAKEWAERQLHDKTDFLGRLSHEIKTPMNAIIGVTDALLINFDVNKIRPELELIQKGADTLLNTLNQTLDNASHMSKASKLEETEENIGDIIKQCVDLWSYQADKSNTKISYKIDMPTPTHVKIDKVKFEQCLNNLISNAVKFSPNGSVFLLITFMKNKTNTPTLIVAVKDTGIGMTPEQKSHIFESYKQADETISSRFGGTGLGLNITKQLTELMGGTIKVESKLGEGTIFILNLPIKSISENLSEKNIFTEQTPHMNSPKDEDESEHDSESQAVAKDVQIESIAQENGLDVTAETLIPETSASESESFTQDLSLCETAEPYIAKPNDERYPEVTQMRNHKDKVTALGDHISKNHSSPTGDIVSKPNDKPRKQPPHLHYKNLNVLIVDDNPTNHFVMHSLLQTRVGNMYTAANGQECLDMLEKHDDIDLVIMDIHMPVMDGIEATIAIRNSSKSWIDIPIIALTADPQYQQARVCKNIGMNDALQKPVKLGVLLKAIDKVMQATASHD